MPKWRDQLCLGLFAEAAVFDTLRSDCLVRGGHGGRPSSVNRPYLHGIRVCVCSQVAGGLGQRRGLRKMGRKERLFAGFCKRRLARPICMTRACGRNKGSTPHVAAYGPIGCLIFSASYKARPRPRRCPGKVRRAWPGRFSACGAGWGAARVRRRCGWF
jgi:hypothetical protein